MATQRPGKRALDSPQQDRRARPQAMYFKSPELALIDQSLQPEAAMLVAKPNPTTVSPPKPSALIKNVFTNRSTSKDALRVAKGNGRRPSAAELYKQGAVDHLRQTDPQFMQQDEQSVGYGLMRDPLNTPHVLFSQHPLDSPEAAVRPVPNKAPPHFKQKPKAFPQSISCDDLASYSFPTKPNPTPTRPVDYIRTRVVSDAALKTNRNRITKILPSLPEDSAVVHTYPPIAGHNSRTRKQSSVGSTGSSKVSSDSFKGFVAGLKKAASSQSHKWRIWRKDDQVHQHHIAKGTISSPVVKESRYYSEGPTSKLVPHYVGNAPNSPTKLQKLSSPSRHQKRMTPLTMVDHHFNRMWQDAGLNERVTPGTIPSLHLTRTRTASDPSVTVVEGH